MKGWVLECLLSRSLKGPPKADLPPEQIPPPWLCGHLGLNNSLLVGVVPSTVVCLVVSLVSTHKMLVATKMSPDIAVHFWEAKALLSEKLFRLCVLTGK